MKPSEIVKDATTELQAAIKELKQGDEEDLGVLANNLYDMAARADKAAGMLEKANQALEDQDTEPEQDEPDDNEPEQQGEPAQEKSS